MLIRPLIHASLLLLIAILLGCANAAPPSGGLRDIMPPKLIATIPADGSVNFKGNTLRLYFDEPIATQGLKKELVITPYTDGVFKSKVRKNVLSITFDDPFLENTTYTLDFGEGIQDVTEKNKGENIRMAFSTGPNIDTLKVSGFITNLLTDKPEKDVVVSLYDAEDTLTITKDKPRYLAKTNEYGEFLLSNLKPGSYHIFGLLEKDNNLIYNKPDEQIAFLSQPIQLDSNVTDIVMGLIGYDIRPIEFVNVATEKQYVKINYNKPISTYELLIEDSLMAANIFHKPHENNLRLYYTGNPEDMADSVAVILNVADSLEQALSHTVNIKFNFNFKGERIDEPFEGKLVSPKENSLITNKLYNLVYEFNKPVRFFNPDSLLLVEVSRGKDNKKDTLDVSEQMEWNYNRTRLVINGLKADHPFSVTFGKEAFISAEQDTLSEIKNSFTLRDAEQHGIVHGNVETDAESFIVQITNEQFQVEDEVFNQKQFTFNFVKPGKKRLRVIIDADQNGEWSKGNFLKQQPPERIFFFPDEIELKANWEIMGEDIIIKVE